MFKANKHWERKQKTKSLIDGSRVKKWNDSKSTELLAHAAACQANYSCECFITDGLQSQYQIIWSQIFINNEIHFKAAFWVQVRIFQTHLVFLTYLDTNEY